VAGTGSGGCSPAPRTRLSRTADDRIRLATVAPDRIGACQAEEASGSPVARVAFLQEFPWDFKSEAEYPNVALTRHASLMDSWVIAARLITVVSSTSAPMVQ
jgi:hypothetical protein